VWRIVHYRDPVPHLPFDKMNFLHYSPEVWYDVEDNTHYVICEDIEDKNCSVSVKPYQWKPNDHNYYVKVPMSC